MPRISAPTMKIERTPPMLSTDSVVSFTCAGTNFSASSRATMESGRVSRNTEPHQKCSSRIPEQSGPSARSRRRSQPTARSRFVRAAPDHSAVISASVVGYAMPAASPPRMRATIRTYSFGAHAARQSAGIVSSIPPISSSFRP